jgi:hypothetical protein
MKILALAMLLSVSFFAIADNKVIPREVKNFVAERSTCDHFRGEPFEGNSPEQIERREFIFDSLDIYCSGTEKRLAALKRRYKKNEAVMKQLNKFEEMTE